MILATILDDFSGGLDFIFHQRESVSGGVSVGGSELLPFLETHLRVVIVSIAIACAISIPLGLLLGHLGKGQFAASSAANVGRAVPSIAVLVFFSAYLGLGEVNLLRDGPSDPGLPTRRRGPPSRPRSVDAARGMGMSGTQIVRRAELPSASLIPAACARRR